MRTNAKLPAVFWIGIGAILVASLTLASLLVVLKITKSSNKTEISPTVILTLIPAPSPTPIVYEGLISTQTVYPEQETAYPGSFSIGVYVQIFGTGGDGLRLRSDAGISKSILFLGYESEVFKIIDGPREADGYIWWNLAAPYDATRSGWAAENYLQLVDLNP